MLSQINITSPTLDAEVSLLSPGQPQNDSWITVIIGQNGSRKSFLLRQILEAALGKKSSLDSKQKKLSLATQGWSESRPKSRVICISGTPLDRFPRTGSSSLKVSKKKDGPGFLYLGQRASNGMAGTSQSERSLMTALFENASNLYERRALFDNVFSHLKLLPRLKIHLKLSKIAEQHFGIYQNTNPLRYMVRDAISDMADKLKKEFSEAAPPEGYSDRIKAALTSLAKTDFAAYLLYNRLLDGLELPPLIFDAGEIRSSDEQWQQWTTAEWEVLVRAGMLEVASTTFFKVERLDNETSWTEQSIDPSEIEEVEGEELSSGQWSWLAGFAGLCAEIRAGSLILVDEPENSLHPKWQQKYIPMLNSIMRSFSGTQAIIATHSPLIASGVNPDWGNVKALKSSKEPGRHTVLRSQPIESTFGWSASDVYEAAFDVPSTRAAGFISTADIALSLIRSRKNITPNERQLLIAELQRNSAALPIFDPMRNILQTIIDELSQSNSEARQ